MTVLDAPTATVMRTELTLVTPEMAADWLRKNGHNRPISAARVRYFESELRSGRAATTHQGIAFNLRDELADGQHRLQAIVNTGIAWLLYVTFDAPVENFNVIDRGGGRSLADLMAIRGFANKNSIAVATLAWQWERGQVSFRGTPRDDELSDFMHRWRDVFADVPRVMKSEVAPPRQLSFVNVIAVDGEFMDDLLDDEPDVGRPAGMLASLWRSRRKQRQNGDLKLELAQFVKARNDHQRGVKPEKKYGLRQAEGFPVPEWRSPVPFNTRPSDEDDET